MTMTYEKARRVPVAQVIADHARCDNCRSDLSMREYAYVTSRGVYCSPTCKAHREGWRPGPNAPTSTTAPRMLSAFEAPCKHCGAKIDEPCRSVGGNIALSPHMQRLKAFKAAGGTWTEQQRESYARDIVARVFGRCDEYLLSRAKKEYGIVLSHPWVKKALGEMPETRRTAAGRWLDPSQEQLL